MLIHVRMKYIKKMRCSRKIGCPNNVIMSDSDSEKSSRERRKSLPSTPRKENGSPFEWTDYTLDVSGVEELDGSLLGESAELGSLQLPVLEDDDPGSGSHDLVNARMGAEETQNKLFGVAEKNGELEVASQNVDGDVETVPALQQRKQFEDVKPDLDG